MNNVNDNSLPSKKKDSQPHGWVKMTRSSDGLELMRLNPNCFLLATIIAFRARWQDSFNADGLEPGEALLGDFQNYGMSERNYRTAKLQLEKFHFATFKATNKGTVGRLTDTRLFNVTGIEGDGQNDGRVTDDRRTGDGRVTTNKTVVRRKEGIRRKEGGVDTPSNVDDHGPKNNAPPQSLFSDTSTELLAKDIRRYESLIESERNKDSFKRDVELIKSYLNAIYSIQTEIKRRNPPVIPKPKPIAPAPAKPLPLPVVLPDNYRDQWNEAVQGKTA